MSDLINDNSRKRLVEAAELAGPNYRDRQIVIASGAKPVIATKDFAYQSEIWLIAWGCVPKGQM